MPNKGVPLPQGVAAALGCSGILFLVLLWNKRKKLSGRNRGEQHDKYSSLHDNSPTVIPHILTADTYAYTRLSAHCSGTLNANIKLYP